MTHIAYVKVSIGDDMVCEVLIGNDIVYDLERHTREANSWINHITHVKVLIGVHVCVSQHRTPYHPLSLDSTRMAMQKCMDESHHTCEGALCVV